jgi:hypothetical protein
MDGSERRKYRRLGAKFDMSYSKIGSTIEEFQSGRTINVSPGGLYFETAAGLFESGNLLKVQLSIPPTSGQLEFGGSISGFARVLRTDTIRESSPGANSSSKGCTVALEFCRPLKLETL